ncbi:MAG: outer membrane beta-barrel protein [Steroidobacteraceae bacterium]
MGHGIAAAVAIAAMTVATSAHAQWEDEQGWYAGAGAGEFKVEIDNFDDVDETIDDYDSDDTAWKAFLGWRMNRFFGTEIAYVNLGSPDDEILPDTFLTVETDGFAPYVTGTLPFGPFEAFAKAGYYFYETEARVNSPLVDFSEDDSGSDFTYSVGLGVTFLERFNLRLEYEQFDFEDIDDSNALWLTGAFRF